MTSPLDTFDRLAEKERGRPMEGTCLWCKTAPATPGYTMCPTCRAKLQAKVPPVPRPKQPSTEHRRPARRWAPPPAPTAPEPKEEAVPASNPSDHRFAHMTCDYCGRDVIGGQGKAAHERACKLNPKNSVAQATEELAQKAEEITAATQPVMECDVAACPQIDQTRCTSTVSHYATCADRLDDQPYPELCESRTDTECSEQPCEPCVLGDHYADPPLIVDMPLTTRGLAWRAGMRARHALTAPARIVSDFIAGWRAAR